MRFMVPSNHYNFLKKYGVDSEKSFSEIDFVEPGIYPFNLFFYYGKNLSNLHCFGIYVFYNFWLWRKKFSRLGKP